MPFFEDLFATFLIGISMIYVLDESTINSKIAKNQINILKRKQKSPSHKMRRGLNPRGTTQIDLGFFLCL